MKNAKCRGQTPPVAGPEPFPRSPVAGTKGVRPRHGRRLTPDSEIFNRLSGSVFFEPSGVGQGQEHQVLSFEVTQAAGIALVFAEGR